MSEASARTIERASKVHPITALQSEYSLWTRDPEENDTLALCRRLGIALVAYSPLGRGFLTGAISRPDDFDADDYRRNNPRFQGENFARNLQLVKRVEALAAAKGCSPAQLALAWVLAQGQDIVPIPGTKRRSRLDENLDALAVELSTAELASLAEIFPLNAAAGERYAPVAMAHIEK
jgi:aryl-alcohol dehydrogenase-like predicted oxidoreductase